MTDTVKSITKLLEKNDFVSFAYLFGSNAKGAADSRSDWDIAVCFQKDPLKLPQWTVFYLESEISREIRRSSDYRPEQS